MHKKKLLRKIMVLALAGIMTFGMSANVFAANSNLNASTDNPADTSTINLLKDYVNGSAYQKNTKSPEETFTFTIDRYGLWNVGEDGNGNSKYTKENMPTFENDSKGNTFTITASVDKAGKTTTDSDKPNTNITVPTYDAVGDYWYKVTEKDNNTAGVLYGTNDSKTENTTVKNGAHDGVYYIHVQVTNNSDKTNYIRTVTLHKTAPNSSVKNAQYETWYEGNNESEDTSVKVNDIQNKYYAGSLEIKKTVTGNAGDKNELFKVTVVFTNDSGANMNSDITYKDFYDEKRSLTVDATSIKWTDTITGDSHSDKTKTVDFYVKDGTTVTFDNIPYGVSYIITETQPTDDKYTHKFDFGNTGESSGATFNAVTCSADSVTGEGTDSSETSAERWSAASATGSISDDSDTVTITNTKESVIDIGVVTNNAPYIAMLILAGAAAFVYVRRRKDLIEE